MMYSHCATALIEVTAARAFDFMADPLALGSWSLGCMNVQAVPEQRLYRGTSMFDGSSTWVEIVAHRETLLIDYRVGSPGNLKPRISARIVPGEVCDLSASQCYLSLSAWRSSGMSAARWQQLCDTHEAEIWLIKSKLENTTAAGM